MSSDLMGCVQKAKRQPLLDSFDLKGVAERIKSGKRMHFTLVSGTAICASSILKQVNCSAMVPVIQPCCILGYSSCLLTLHPLCVRLVKMLLLPAALQRR